MMIPLNRLLDCYWKLPFPTTADEITDELIAERASFPDGVTIPTAQEVRDIANAYVPPTQDELNSEAYDQAILNNKIIKALIMALNDGSFVPGSNYTAEQIKTGIKNRM